MYLERYQRKIILLQAKILELLSEPDKKPDNLDDNFELTNNSWVCRKNDAAMKADAYVCYHSDERRISYARIRVSDLERYIKGGTATKTLPVFDEFCRELFQGRFNEYTKPISDEARELGVFSFGELIGFTRPEARFLLDNHFASHFPTFSTFSQTLKPTTDFVMDHGGVYSLYRYDQNQATKSLGYPMGVILCCRVSVRYPVPFKHIDSDGRQTYRVRCKLNIPEYVKRDFLYSDADRKTFKCDGYVSLRGKNWWQWLFQIRRIDHRNSNDLILMYTNNKPQSSTGLEYRQAKILYQDQSITLEPTFSEGFLFKHADYHVGKKEIRESIKRSNLPNLDNYFEMNKGEREVLRKPRVVDPMREDMWSGKDNEFDFDREPIKLLLEKHHLQGR